MIQYVYTVVDPILGICDVFSTFTAAHLRLQEMLVGKKTDKVDISKSATLFPDQSWYMLFWVEEDDRHYCYTLSRKLIL